MDIKKETCWSVLEKNVYNDLCDRPIFIYIISIKSEEIKKID